MMAMTDCEYKSCYMRDVLCSKVTNQYDYAITAAKIINNSKKQLHAMYKKIVLCSENALSNHVALKAAYIIDCLDEEYQLEYIRYAANNNLSFLKGSGSKIIRSIPKPIININTIKLEDTITLLESDNEKNLDDINAETVKKYIKVIQK